MQLIKSSIWSFPPIYLLSIHLPGGFPSMFAKVMLRSHFFNVCMSAFLHSWFFFNLPEVPFLIFWKRSSTIQQVSFLFEKKCLKIEACLAVFFFAGRFGPMNLFAAWKIPCLFYLTRYSPTWKGTPTYIPHHPASSINRESFLTTLLVMFLHLTYQMGGMFLVSGHFLWACFKIHLSGTFPGADQMEVCTNELCNLYG